MLACITKFRLYIAILEEIAAINKIVAKNVNSLFMAPKIVCLRPRVLVTCKFFVYRPIIFVYGQLSYQAYHRVENKESAFVSYLTK